MKRESSLYDILDPFQSRLFYVNSIILKLLLCLFVCFYAQFLCSKSLLWDAVNRQVIPQMHKLHHVNSNVAKQLAEASKFFVYLFSLVPDNHQANS